MPLQLNTNLRQISFATSPSPPYNRAVFKSRSLTSSGESIMHPMLNIAIRAARAAGQIIVKNFADPSKVETMQKAMNDLVTNVDHEAENAIIQTIKKSYPDHAIIAEESGLTSGKDAEYQWIIDPLDGTTNFVKGIRNNFV